MTLKSISPLKRVVAAVLAILSIALYNTEAKAQDVFDDMVGRIVSGDMGGLIQESDVKMEQMQLKAAVAPSDPEVEFEYLWPSAKGELNRWSVGVSQELPDFRKMGATSRLVDALEVQGDRSAEASKAKARLAAEMKLIEYIGARKELELLSYIHENFDSLIVSYTKAWERGEVNILDLNKIKIEHARAHAAQSAAHGNVEALAGEIIALSQPGLTRDELSLLTDYPSYAGIAGQLADIDLDGDVLEFIRRTPEYSEWESRSNTAKFRIDLASKGRFPRFSVGYQHAYEDGTHFNGVTLGMSLPVFSRGAESSEAYWTKMNVDWTWAQVCKELGASFRASVAKANALRHQLDMLGPAVENTNNIRLLKMALDGGEINLLEYLQETSYFTEAAREYNSARLEYVLTLASLVRYMGQN